MEKGKIYEVGINGVTVKAVVFAGLAVPGFGTGPDTVNHDAVRGSTLRVPTINGQDEAVIGDVVVKLPTTGRFIVLSAADAKALGFLA
jgi:hypothetical protein